MYPMHDIKKLRAELDSMATALNIKGFDLDKDAFQALDARRKDSDVQTQDLLAKRKQASKKIGELVQSGMSVDEAKQQVNETLALIDNTLEDLKSQAAVIEVVLVSTSS